MMTYNFFRKMSSDPLKCGPTPSYFLSMTAPLVVLSVTKRGFWSRQCCFLVELTSLQRTQSVPQFSVRNREVSAIGSFIFKENGYIFVSFVPRNGIHHNTDVHYKACPPLRGSILYGIGMCCSRYETIKFLYGLGKRHQQFMCCSVLLLCTQKRQKRTPLYHLFL